MSDGLYALDPSDDSNYIKTNDKKHLQLRNTIKENYKYLPPRQVLRVKRARKLFHAMGNLTADDLKAIIQMNLIQNNMVTTDNINLATKVFGDDIGALKGKITRRKPTPVTSNIIEIPNELIEVQQDVILSMDGITVNSIKFLTTISHEIYYRMAQYVIQTNANKYKKCLNEIKTLYKQGGFEIKEIRCDNEFRQAMDKYQENQESPIKINYAAAQEHVPQAKQNNRMIKERV
jgi:hypothetical protein